MIVRLVCHIWGNFFIDTQWHFPYILILKREIRINQYQYINVIFDWLDEVFKKVYIPLFPRSSVFRRGVRNIMKRVFEAKLL